MDPTIAGMISGGANLIGSMFSSDTSAKNVQAQIAAQEAMQTQSEQFNAQQASLNRDFQQQMSSTAYQRATADMKAAGLNPAMMFGGGGAASTPGGSVASTGTPSVPVSQSQGRLAGLGNAVTNAVNTAISAKTLDKMSEEIANMKAQEALTTASKMTEEQRPKLVGAQTAATLAGAKLTREQATNTEISRQIVGNEATRALHERELRERFPWIDQAGLSGRTASDVVAPLVSSALGAKRFMPDRWFW